MELSGFQALWVGYASTEEKVLMAVAQAMTSTSNPLSVPLGPCSTNDGYRNAGAFSPGGRMAKAPVGELGEGRRWSPDRPFEPPNLRLEPLESGQIQVPEDPDGSEALLLLLAEALLSKPLPGL